MKYFDSVETDASHEIPICNNLLLHFIFNSVWSKMIAQLNLHFKKTKEYVCAGHFMHKNL